MNKLKAVTCIAVVLVIALFVFVAYSLSQKFQAKEAKDRAEKAHNIEFYKHRHDDFLKELERRDRISDQEQYDKRKRENTQRYEELKGTPQVIWGTINAPANKDLGNRLRMSVKLHGNRRIHKIVVDDQMHFAFPLIDPNVYEVILYETSACPGVRLENVMVNEGQAVPELVVNIEQAVIEVTVTDSRGNAVEGGQVLVGKSSGGANPNLYTWRRGLADSQGKLVATNLTDGKYVVAVHTLTRNGSVVIPLLKDEHKKVDVTLTHDN
jgi:hypothetical protein